MGPADVIGLACVAAAVAPCLAGVEWPGRRVGPIGRALGAAVLAWLAVASAGFAVLGLLGLANAAAAHL